MIIIDILMWIFILISVFLMLLFMVSIKFDKAAETSVTLLEKIGEFLQKHNKLERFMNILYYSGLLCFITKGIMLFIGWLSNILRGLGIL